MMCGSIELCVYVSTSACIHVNLYSFRSFEMQASARTILKAGHFRTTERSLT